jgi:hypothetical protein
MVSQWVRKWIALGVVGAAAPVAGALGQGAAPETAPQTAVPFQIKLPTTLEDQAEGTLTLIADVEVEAAEDEGAAPSEYYIGIALGELPELVKTQLKLEHGLVVDDVIEGSPAAKAEFKVQDILIRADDAKIAEAADILKAVDVAKDKEMRILVLRDGKELTLKVTPAKRPKPEAGEVRKTETLEARVPASAIQRIEEALRELKGEDGAARALELYFPRAGVVAPKVQTLKVAELPKNLKISITRDGDGPAKIHVERDGKEWDATDDKLGELPADVRTNVEQMLSKVIHPMLSTRARALIVGGPKNAYAYSPGTPGVPAVVPYPGASGVPGVQVAPPVPATAPATAARLHAYRVVESKGSSLEAKVDQILKKLNDDDDSAVEKLRDEVERLRKEVEALKNK